MHKIAVNDHADSKPSFLVSTQAAAAITVGAAQLVIFIGTNVLDINNQRCVTALENLRDLLKENEYPVGPLGFTVAAGEPPSREAYTVIDIAALGAAHTEDEVIIAYGLNFYPAGNSSVYSNLIDRATEVFQEQILKLN